MIYAPVNFCIYCNKKYTPHELTDEHIVPFALNGNMLLPKSSCTICQKEINRYEAFILKEMYEIPRKKLNLKSRNKSNDIAQIETRKFCSDGLIKEVKINKDTFPNVLFYPILGKPKVMGDLWASSEPIRLRLAKLKNDLNTFPENERVRIGSFNPYKFYQFLAKIAFSYAVAEMGYENIYFKEHLQNVILGKESEDNMNLLIGSDNYPIKSTKSLDHYICLQGIQQGKTMYNSVGICLFGITPVTYRVIISIL